jgi:hypothetical protein
MALNYKMKIQKMLDHASTNNPIIKSVIKVAAKTRPPFPRMMGPKIHFLFFFFFGSGGGGGLFLGRRLGPSAAADESWAHLNFCTRAKIPGEKKGLSGGNEFNYQIGRIFGKIIRPWAHEEIVTGEISYQFLD